MSRTEPALRGNIDEDNAVVERFIDASREIVPTCQVTLAKRIIRPGSNRVLCLAARTSVPLDDDTVASVSDLALKLSDGTNVVLSLSFFNDAEAGGNIIPLGRSIYDPNKYDVSGNSRLGAFLIATCIVAASCIYAVASDRFGAGFGIFQKNIHSNIQQAFLAPAAKIAPGKAQQQQASRLNPAAIKAPVQAAAAQKHSSRTEGSSAAPTSSHSTKIKTSDRTSRSTAKATKRSTGISAGQPSSLLIPPPPPMALPPIDPSRLQMLNAGMFPENWMFGSGSAAKPAFATTAPVLKQEPRARVSNLPMPAPAQARDTSPKKDREPLATRSSQSAPAEAFPPARAEAAHAPLQNTETVSPSAPLPGDALLDPAALELERIRL